MVSKNEDDKVVALLCNTSGRHVILDKNTPGIDRVFMKPDSTIGLNANQLEHVGKLPPGVVIKSYDPKRHGPKGRIGGHKRG